MPAGGSLLAKTKALKQRFGCLDHNGSGKLSFDGLLTLLRAGNPSMTQAEAQVLFNCLDSARSGVVDLHDLVDFVYGESESSGKSDRQHRLMASSARRVASEEQDWAVVEEVFDKFAGRGRVLDGREFSKLCSDCRLYDRNFEKNDADIIFLKVCRKGERKIDCEQFQDCLRLVAQKKGCTTAAVQEVVGLSRGPEFQGTKADAVRFHDDKSTYTGLHAFVHQRGGSGKFEDEASGAVMERSASGRHARLAETAIPAIVEDQEGDWSQMRRAYEEYMGPAADLEGKEFAKFCSDFNLCDRRCTKNDVDIVFAKVLRKGERRIGFEQFQMAMRIIAAKKGWSVIELQAACQDAAGARARLRRVQSSQRARCTQDPVMHGVRSCQLVA
mmetsp:Transcript_9242/g.20645  ORF Transcript_9242/g.20645 Transcript_9242/m.20645 type:complete len:386 (-) Transcript_9242:206-1363(-)